jgi:hypothetical protein
MNTRFTATGGRARRAILAVGVVGLAVLLAPAAAGAAPGGTGHTVSFTDHIHGAFTEPAFDTNPCTGAAITSFDADGNVVAHVTFFPAGEEIWATFTETGKVTIVDSDNVTYTGHFAAWGNFNVNEKNSNSVFTVSITLVGSNSTTLTAHEVVVFALNANGVATVDFDTFRLTCG